MTEIVAAIFANEHWTNLTAAHKMLSSSEEIVFVPLELATRYIYWRICITRRVFVPKVYHRLISLRNNFRKQLLDSARGSKQANEIFFHSLYSYRLANKIWTRLELTNQIEMMVSTM